VGGSLCAVFVSAVKVDQYHLNLLQVLSKAASIEEDRKRTEETFKIQAMELDNALKDALKSREVLLSMLEDNHLNKEKLEQNVQELDRAYSKLKESQEELLQSAKFGAIGQLASSVAHEVRNPLAIIMQSLDYLDSRITPEDQEIVQIAKNNIKRANTIVATLLDFSKVKRMDMKAEDINSIIVDSLVLIQYSNLKDQVKVVTELAGDLPKIIGDRQKIEQVFVNLFLNAVQAMPKGGNLYVCTHLAEFNTLRKEIKDSLAVDSLPIKNVIMIEVQDEGVGIAEENMKNIFRPFFTTKGAMMGIGLGLSVVKDIITMHKGSITFESQVNKGTKATIILRVA
jgi:two-component system NtrC family sensor kinase